MGQLIFLYLEICCDINSQEIKFLNLVLMRETAKILQMVGVFTKHLTRLVNLIIGLLLSKNIIHLEKLTSFVKGCIPLKMTYLFPKNLSKSYKKFDTRFRSVLIVSGFGDATS